MSPNKQQRLRIGIACLPRIGGSGILATTLGRELAARGHEVVVFSPCTPSRFEEGTPGLTFHPVAAGPAAELFPPPDYSEALASAIVAEAAKAPFDALHAHYGFPHARGILRAAEQMGGVRPCLVTTLHGSDVARLMQEPEHAAALAECDVVTTVSAFLRDEARAVLSIPQSIGIIPNFFRPTEPRRSRAEIRAELGLHDDQFLAVHMSNVRAVKRLDLLFQALAAGDPHLRLLVLAGGDFTPYAGLVRSLGLESRVFVRHNVTRVEDWLPAADCGVYTSERESFGLSILETQFHAIPVLAFRVGGIPCVVPDARRLVPFGNVAQMAQQWSALASDPARARALGQEARRHVLAHFTADRVVPQYENCYTRVACAAVSHGVLET